VNRFTDWILSIIGPVIAAISLGYWFGSRGKTKVESDLMASNTELKKKENEETVKENNAGKSTDDIVNDAISKGRQIINK